MELYLVRHGETEWSRARRHTSRTDLPLSPAGEAEAKALGDHLRGLEVDRVLSSPLARATAIQDRTKEHLVTSDKAVVTARKLLLQGIQDVKQGRDPLHIVREPAKNDFSHLAVVSEVTEKGADIRQVVTKKIEAQRELASSKHSDDSLADMQTSG